MRHRIHVARVETRRHFGLRLVRRWRRGLFTHAGKVAAARGTGKRGGENEVAVIVPVFGSASDAFWQTPRYPPRMNVLVVEDEKKTAALIRKALEAEGMSVEVLHRGDEVVTRATAASFDAIVLDIMLPGHDGVTALRLLRAHSIATPVLLLSARGEVDERVNGLNAGADDYLPKPFVLAELIARVRALARRGAGRAPAQMSVADLKLDTLTRVAHRGGAAIPLTPREFRLLEFLMRTPGRVRSRSEILENVWDYTFDPGTNIVDVCVKRLREKIDTDGGVKLLHNVRGEGFVIKASA